MAKRGSYTEARQAGFLHRGIIFCERCGGAYIEVGVSGGREIPHADDCPRNPANQQTEEEQDRERAELSILPAPFRGYDDDLFHDPFNCPDPTGDHCEDARRKALVRAGVRIPGLRAKREDVLARGDEFPRPVRVAEGEPISLVEQSNKREGDYLGV